MENCYLYVLRYNYSDNYYVGSTTEDLKDRMKRHLKENYKKGTPSWSCKNKSSKGFRYYWFCINEKGESRRNADYTKEKLQSIGDYCENTFIDEIMKEIEKIMGNELDSKISIYGGYLAKPPYPKVKSVEKDALVDDERHKKISKYLKDIKEHKLGTKEGEFSISLFEVGTIGEYHKKIDYYKDWHELATVEFSNDNKEK